MNQPLLSELLGWGLSLVLIISLFVFITIVFGPIKKPKGHGDHTHQDAELSKRSKREAGNLAGRRVW